MSKEPQRLECSSNDLIHGDSMQVRLQSFKTLLDSIDGLNSEKSRLWLEIYGNALTDRQLAYEMFIKLSAITEDKSTEHAVHARSMVSYIEKMSKSNDQLLKLAELVNSVEKKEVETTDDDIYNEVNKTPKGQ